MDLTILQAGPLIIEKYVQRYALQLPGPATPRQLASDYLREMQTAIDDGRIPAGALFVLPDSQLRLGDDSTGGEKK